MLVRTQITCEVEIKFLDFFFRGPRRGLGSEISSSVMRKANMSGWDEVHIRGYQPAQVVHSTPRSFKKPRDFLQSGGMGRRGLPSTRDHGSSVK